MKEKIGIPEEFMNQCDLKKKKKKKSHAKKEKAILKEKRI